MNVHYISPSSLPSRSANSVHVVMQVRALADSGATVTLYACRTVSDETELPEAIQRQYGVSFNDIRLVTFRTDSGKGVNMRIAALAICKLPLREWPDLIISRNLYAAFLIGVVARRSLIYEIHDVETGIRGCMQRAILRQPVVRIVVISKKLRAVLTELYGVSSTSTQVLHDAAPSGILPVSQDKRHILLGELVPEANNTWRGVCGYFGHLHKGRGIEIIEEMATRRPDVLFLIAGGREEDIAFRRKSNTAANLIFLGHLPHYKALHLAKCVDILLMPYQASVSVGVVGRDTAQWMSPMKMFEYLATGVPLISSDLPVLREILHDGENSVLVRPDDPDAWMHAIDRILSDNTFAHFIAQNAHEQYLIKHTWEHRAHELIGSF